ncbi:MAG: hypothetical protein M3P06_22530 [Acidobacteriota bacterium]|nr:hypothetical protein [Acidobacteriota bacterium]
MRVAVVVAFFFFVACGDREKISHNEGTISRVSQTWSVAPSFDGGPTRNTLKLEFTMPKDFPIDARNPWIAMTDSSGRHFQAKKMSVSTTGDGVVKEQSVSATFELAEDSQFGVAHIGDYYDINIVSGRITRRAGSTAP